MCYLKILNTGDQTLEMETRYRGKFFCENIKHVIIIALAVNNGFVIFVHSGYPSNGENSLLYGLFYYFFSVILLETELPHQFLFNR